MSEGRRNLLATISGSRWVSAATFGLVDGGEPRLVETLADVTSEVDLADDRLAIRRDRWKMDVYFRYRPLVYFAAFGGPDLFGCLRVAVESLFEFGGYDGDVCILTDAEHTQWAATLPDALRTRVRSIALQAADMLDWTLARYRIIDIPELRGFRPYLYLDSDIVCNAPIDSLLRYLATSHVLHVPGEGELLNPADYYGASLLAADGVAVAPKRPGFSTCVLGFPDIATVESLFSIVPLLATGYAGHAGTRTAFDCFDQPFANYAVVKGSRCEMALVNRFLENRHFWHDRTSERRGLTHFTGGTNAAAPKLQAMTTYRDRLRADGGR